MLQNAKALCVVLVLGLLAFRLCRPIALAYMIEASFRRRRNVWVGLAGVAFLSPSFWIWAAFAVCLLVWAASNDDNPLALYAFVFFAVPPVYLVLPAPLVNQLFEVSPARLFALTLLVAALLRSRRDWEVDARPSGADFVVLAFLVLQVVLLIPYEALTNTMRRAFLLMLDMALVIYAFERVGTFAKRAEILSALWISTAVMAPIAVFESVKGWLLYTGVNERWGDPNAFAWLFRGDALRAQTTFGHSIGLGYEMAMAIGCYLFLRRARHHPKTVELSIVALMCAALFVSYSRGAWVTAAIVALTFALIMPGARERALKNAAWATAVVLIALASPLRNSVVSRLPFIGDVDQDTVSYRQELARVSWELVKQNPWFGDPFVTQNMESLRQGQGIIDLVNGYLTVALYTGLTGMMLQCSIFAMALWAGFTAYRSTRDAPDEQRMIAALLACFIGTLVFIATAGIGTTAYVFSGLLLSMRARARFLNQSMVAGPSLGSEWRRARY